MSSIIIITPHPNLVFQRHYHYLTLASKNGKGQIPLPQLVLKNLRYYGVNYLLMLFHLSRIDWRHLPSSNELSIHCFICAFVGFLPDTAIW